MALTPEQEKQFEEMFKQKLQEQYTKGLRVGILTVSKIVLDKLNDSSKPFMKRVEDVKHFCKSPWGKQKKVEKPVEDSETTDDTTSENPTETPENGEN